MKTCKVLSLTALVLSWSGAAGAQDPVKVDPGHYKVMFENAAVRVLKIDYPAGEKSQMHQHPDAIVIPLSASRVRFGMPDGKSEDRDMVDPRWPSRHLLASRRTARHLHQGGRWPRRGQAAHRARPVSLADRVDSGRGTLAYGMMEDIAREGRSLGSFFAVTDGKPERLIGPGKIWGGRLSPDGRWLAYYSLESGGFEVYVTPSRRAARAG